jgi:hypothetical protein
MTTPQPSQLSKTQDEPEVNFSGSTIRNEEDTINNALDGDVVLTVVQAAVDGNSWVATVNAFGTLIVGIGTLVVAVWAVRLTRRQTDIQDANRETAEANLEVAQKNLELAKFNRERDEAWRRHELFDRRYSLFQATSQVLGDVVYGSEDAFDKSYDDFQRLRLRDQYYLKEELSKELVSILGELTKFKSANKRMKSNNEEFVENAKKELMRIDGWAEQELFDGKWREDFEEILRVE